jgi:uncharacterized membrane protein YbaN (DUF454 family)
VFLGVIGLVLPVLQGILFLLIGFALLSKESPFIRRLHDRLRARYPKLAEKMDMADARAQRVWSRLVARFNGGR